MKQIPQKVANKAWETAGKFTWTVEDWKDAYHTLTALFMRISARHAKQQIETLNHAEADRDTQISD